MSEVAPVKSFEEKMKARIKESIGDLVSDEDLTKLVERGLEETFFKPRPNPKYGSYGYNSSQPVTIEPLIQEILRETLLPSMKAAVETYLKDHHEEVMVMVDTVVKEGAGKAVVKAVELMFTSQMMSLQQSMQTALMNRN